MANAGYGPDSSRFEIFVSDGAPFALCHQWRLTTRATNAKSPIESFDRGFLGTNSLLEVAMPVRVSGVTSPRDGAASRNTGVYATACAQSKVTISTQLAFLPVGASSTRVSSPVCGAIR